jgi:hypothetical protein
MSTTRLKRLWRRTVRSILNPRWREQALRSRQLGQAVTRFQHRTVHRDLALDVLAHIPDDELIQAVHDCVESRLPHGHTGAVPVDAGVPRGSASVYSFQTLDYDVWNGGFDRFLEGAGAEAAGRAAEALRFLGVPEVADIVEQARARFNAGKSTGRCEARYAKLQAAVEQQIITFIRKHPDEFTTTRTG